MTATHREVLAVLLLITSVSLASIAFGVAIGATYAWRQSADWVAEAREAQAEAAMAMVRCEEVLDECVCAVAGRCRKGDE